MTAFRINTLKTMIQKTNKRISERINTSQGFIPFHGEKQMDNFDVSPTYIVGFVRSFERAP